MPMWKCLFIFILSYKLRIKYVIKYMSVELILSEIYLGSNIAVFKFIYC